MDEMTLLELGELNKKRSYLNESAQKFLANCLARVFAEQKDLTDKQKETLHLILNPLPRPPMSEEEKMRRTLDTLMKSIIR
jgi:hypothetical protein